MIALAPSVDSSRWCPLIHAPGVFGHTLHIPAGDGALDLVPPKARLANIRWRKQLIAKAEESESFRDHLRTLCAARDARGKPSIDAFLFWLNAFGFTYRQLVIDPSGEMRPATGIECDVPFITWPKQDRLALELLNCIIGGQDAAVEKSRDTGLTWLIVAVLHWLWQFYPNMNFMAISRVEALVDDPGDPDSIFWKHDYLIAKQPDWMLPAYRRVKLKLLNLSLGSTIIGKSTTGKQGHGGRKTAAFIDEAARIDELKELWQGAASMTSCRNANSTPCGPGFFADLIRSGKPKVLRFPWWEHPEKGIGRRIETDDDGNARVVSDWYLGQVARAVDRREIAENLDMDHGGAGFVFFDGNSITRQITTYARQPVFVGELRIPDDITLERDLASKSPDRVAFEPGAGRGGGSWRIYDELARDASGVLRPRKDRTYVMGADVSHGLSASNSTLVIGCKETGEVVAEYASAAVSPDEFARVSAAAGLFWGGDKGYAFLVPERNGPGGIYIKQLVKLGYPWIYRHMDESSSRGEPMDDYGWYSSRQAKIDLLGWLRGALARDEVICCSEPCLQEALNYVYYESGGVGPASLVAESAAATATHGDRVIGLALMVHGLRWVHRSKVPALRPPEGSPAYRRMQAERNGPRR